MHLTDKPRGIQKTWTINKYHKGDYKLGRKPFDRSVFHENVLLDEGITELLNLAVGTTSAVPWNQTNAYLGVGNSTASSGLSTLTELVSTAPAYVQCSTGYPTVSNQTVTWQAAYTSGVANFAWREFTVRNSATTTGAAKNLNRRVSNQGTKVAGQTWTLSLAVTIS